MTNFDFLASTPSFASFAEPAAAAEKNLFHRPNVMRHDLPTSYGNCRQMDVLGGQNVKTALG